MRMKAITVICGSVFSGRSKQIQALVGGKKEQALLITPTRRLAQLREEQLIRETNLPGLWNRRSRELSEYAALLLERSGCPVRMATRLERNRIVWLALKTLADQEEIPEVSAGFVRHLLQVITSMKQNAVEVADLDRAIDNIREKHPFDRLVSKIYKAYQHELLQRELYDVPGLFWAVEQRCKEGLIALPEEEQWLLLDGFDDFTASQQRLLLALASLASGMVIGLNYDAEAPDLEELYALQRRWLEKFQQITDVQIVRCPTAPEKSRSAYASRYLFSQHTPPPPAETLSANVTLMPAADACHEIESIGRTIKSLLLNDALRPAEIAVAFPDMEQQAPLVEEIFTRFSIPVMMRTRLPLSRSRPAIFLLRLVKAVQEQSLQEFAPLLASPAFDRQDDSPQAVQSLVLLIRESNITGRLDESARALNYLQRLIEQKRDGNERSRLSQGCTPEAMQLLLERLDQIREFTPRLPAEGTFRLYSESLSTFLDLPGLNRDTETEPGNQEAIAALRRILAEMASPFYENQPVTFSDYFALFRMALSEESVCGRGRSGVFCCSLTDLRLNAFPVVFLGGLNEGALPGAAAINALYSDRDLARFRKEGLSMPGSSEHLQKQRLLFHHALCAAEKSLFVGWRNQDQEDREILPSPFAVELRELFQKAVPPLTVDEPAPDCFIADLHQVASPEDFRLSARYHQATIKSPSLCALLEPAQAMIEMEQTRATSKNFSVYDGMIESPELKADLLRRFGEKHQFSVSQLEEYLKFPFSFFTKYVLKIKETRYADGEITPLLRGVILHYALKLFYEVYRQKPANTLKNTSPEERSLLIQNSLDRAFEEQRFALSNIAPVVVALEKARLNLLLDQFIQEEAATEDSFVPWVLEYSFGTSSRPEQDPLSTALPFTYEVGEMQIMFAGIIDRIDKDNLNRLRIIDYKSSSAPTKKEIKEGLSLQLSIYAAAAEASFPGCSSVEGWYIPLLKKKPQEALFAGKESESLERNANAVAMISKAICGIRAGCFPPLPHQSLNLDYFTLPQAARYEAWRVAEKTDPFKENPTPVH